MRPVSRTVIQTLPVSIERVFALLTDPSRMAEWLPGCAGTQSDKPLRTGVRFKVRFGQRTSERSWRVEGSVMTEREAFYSVDRLERAVAVLVGDDGVGLDVLKKTLPVKVRAGVVLRVRLDAAGNPDWSSAAIDDAERERRLQEARECLERLRGTDPGGDVVL